MSIQYGTSIKLSGQVFLLQVIMLCSKAENHLTNGSLANNFTNFLDTEFQQV
jgi:hypothetical protein